MNKNKGTSRLLQGEEWVAGGGVRKGMDGKVVGMEGRVGSEFVSGGNTAPVVGMLRGRLGSGGNLGRDG